MRLLFFKDLCYTDNISTEINNMTTLKSIKKEYYSWRAYDQDVRALATKIKARKLKFNAIYGLPRGGLVLAVSLSHILGRPLIFEASNITARTLLVDDIIETGRTLRRLVQKSKIQNPLIATIYFNKEKGTIQPTIFVREQKQWVVFPWETESSSKYDNTI